MDEEIEEAKKSICRVCLRYNCDKFSEGLSLFEKYNDLFVYEKINYIASIEITKDENLPDRICSACLLALDSACNFKQQCESSDAFLHSKLQVGEPLEALFPIKQEVIGIDDYMQANSPSFSEELETKDYEIDIEKYDTNVDSCNDKPKAERPFKSKAIDLKLECHDCGGSFKSKCKLQVHWKKVHLPQQLICPNCKQTHKSYKAFHNHLKRQTQSCVNADQVRVEGEGKSRVFYCKACNATSKRIYTILAHLVIHTGERPFACNICGRAFTQRSGLTAHKESVHKTFVKEETCEHCGKHIQGRNKWFRHIRSHSTQRFPCTVCHKLFTLKETLKNHMKRHSGVKSYACEICAKTFYTSSDLRNHKVKTHLRTRIYTCNECEYKSWNYACMAKHRPKHTGNNFPCTICGRFLENEQQLALHKKRHLEKNFRCSYCDKLYFGKRNLASHIKKKHNLYGPSSNKNDGKVEIKVNSQAI